MLWCHQVTLQVEPREIFWKLLVEIDWKERDGVHKSISNWNSSSFHLSFPKHFSNISCWSSKCTWLIFIVSSHLIKVKNQTQEAQVTDHLFVIQIELNAKTLAVSSVSFSMLKIYETNCFPGLIFCSLTKSSFLFFT